MAELIFFIGIIVYVVNAIKKASENEKRQNNANRNYGTATYQAPRPDSRQQSARVQVQQDIQRQVEKTKQRIIENRGIQQVQASRMEARNTTILERAKANADENKVDITMETMEAEHHHSERVSAAVHHHSDDVIPENMLGNIEDLMIKGYDGNLCFERDFVGEGLDMISRFTVPTDMPDFSKSDIA